ncbi:MAG TPA: nucleotide disphospho-sugar-binding domain-containing protein [Gemmataceae bacterium]|nr:nucleotide disphospho-sugar-binding domain-containing protein [Gemmataceae bacterium]
MDLLLVTMGSTGDVHPFLGLGQALRARGHRVVVLTYPAFAPLVESAGLEFACLPRPPREAPGSAGVRRLLDSLMKAIGRRWRKLARQSTIVPMLRPVYEAIRRRAVPGRTVVLAHHQALGARIAHDHFGTPLITIHLSPIGLRSANHPPLQPPLRFPSWTPPWFVRAVYWMLDVLVIDRVLGKAVNGLRRDLGLPPVRRLCGAWKDSPQGAIGLFPDWFGPPQPDWPPHTRVTGFPLFDGGDQGPLDPALHQFLDGPRPVVLTAMSEMRHNQRFFQQGVAACSLLGRRGLLLTRFREQVPEPLPTDFFWREYAPFSQVLPHAAVLVHHGGIGTAARALAAGVPQLVVPIKNDQFDNARRLERLGVALVLHQGSCTAAAMARHLDRLLASAEIAERCRELAARLRSADGAGEACALIEALHHASERAA